MVLINGVKYACERCIRGHRVTTCTHTDQPLMMIKPKGRPSTQCGHCKEVRRIRNSHVKCKCGNKGSAHANDCPCHVTGECSCGNKKKGKKGATSANGATPGVSTPSTVGTLRASSTVTPASNMNDTPLASTTAAKDFDFDFDFTPTAAAMALDSSSMSTAANDLIGAWDMNSLAPTYNDSNVSLMSASSQARKPHRQIGMDPLDNIKPVPVNLRQKRVGEISIPMDEYVKPFNKMTSNFNNLISNIGDVTSPLESPGSSKGVSPENGQTLPDSKQTPGFLSDLYDLPAGTSSGGLLGFLDDGGSQVPIPSPAPTPGLAEGGLDSFFPLHPLIGPSPLTYNSTGNSVSSQNSNRLSTSNLSTHNNSTSLLQQALKKIPTGSSTSSYNHHHGASHNHGHSHFQPYPRRSSSFVSMSSGHSVGSSANGSPSNWDEPQLLTAEVAEVQPFYGGPQLTTAKTNTTLMDDIYQTRTYTESQNGDARSRESMVLGEEGTELDPRVLETFLNS